MKVCLLCGETYSDPIDFCFRDGEVLASAESRQATPMRARTESFSATPGLVTAAAVVEDDEPEVTRANRRALMRAAAAAYLVTDPAPAPGEQAENGAGELPAPEPLHLAGTVSPEVAVSGLDRGMAEPPWPLEEEIGEEPARSSMFAAALIGSLVVVAAALGAGLLVLVGLGQRSPEVPPVTGRLEATRAPAPASAVRADGYDVAPTPRPFGADGTSRTAAPNLDGAEPPPSQATPAEGASDFLVVLGDGSTHGSEPLVLYVDGVRAGVVPVNVRLTPGEHTFRVTTDTSGGPVLEVRRTVERPSDPTATHQIDLSD